MQFISRPANEEDLDFISRLSAQVFSKYGRYDEIVPAWYWEPGVIAEIIMEKDNPLGFAMLVLERQRIFEPRRAHLMAIGVLPKHQRKGIGAALLAHMEDLARMYGANEMHLWTAVDNKLALTFFQNAGFKIIGSAERYYPRGQPALALCKSLDLT